MIINKEIYFDQLQKKLEKVLHGKDLTLGELDDCFFWITDLKKDYIKMTTHGGQVKWITMMNLLLLKLNSF